MSGGGDSPVPPAAAWAGAAAGASGPPAALLLQLLLRDPAARGRLTDPTGLALAAVFFLGLGLFAVVPAAVGSAAGRAVRGRLGADWGDRRTDLAGGYAAGLFLVLTAGGCLAGAGVMED